MLNKKQELFKEIALKGFNIFLTGGAGVGKTYVLKEFIDEASKDKNVMVTSTIGIAASNIGGVTSHKAFNMPLGALTYNYNNYSVEDEIVYSDIIVIEEISTCRVDQFDFISHKIAKANKKRKFEDKKPIQLIVCGDFFQLPPVMTRSEKIALDNFYGYDVEIGFAFNSKFWKMFNFKTVYLDEVIRQSDLVFINSLNKIRTGNKAYIGDLYKNSCNREIENTVTLCALNSEVSYINNRELAKISGDKVIYTAITEGEVIESEVIADKDLVLKIGAKVMFLVNSEDTFNGQTGTVRGLYSDCIVVDSNGKLIIVKQFTWDIYKYKLKITDDNNAKIVMEKCGTFTQIPVKLAYAITIHKSQGLTYESANIEPYCWDCGQLYVALSRVKDINKIHFKNKPEMRHIVTSLNVIKFYNSLEYIEDIKSLPDYVVNDTKEHFEYEEDMNKILELLK